MTADEFEIRFAQRRGVSVDTLREKKLYPRPCHCNNGSCHGWTMARLGAPIRVDIDEARLADLQARSRLHDEQGLGGHEFG